MYICESSDLPTLVDFCLRAAILIRKPATIGQVSVSQGDTAEGLPDLPEEDTSEVQYSQPEPGFPYYQEARRWGSPRGPGTGSSDTAKGAVP